MSEISIMSVGNFSNRVEVLRDHFFIIERQLRPRNNLRCVLLSIARSASANDSYVGLMVIGLSDHPFSVLLRFLWPGNDFVGCRGL